eukprot:gene11987-5388_t
MEVEIDNSEVNFDKVISMIDVIQQQSDVFFDKLENSFEVPFSFDEASKRGKEITKNINILINLIEETNINLQTKEKTTKIDLLQLSKNIQDAIESKRSY